MNIYQEIAKELGVPQEYSGNGSVKYSLKNCDDVTAAMSKVAKVMKNADWWSEDGECPMDITFTYDPEEELYAVYVSER